VRSKKPIILFLKKSTHFLTNIHKHPKSLSQISHQNPFKPRIIFLLLMLAFVFCEKYQSKNNALEREYHGEKKQSWCKEI
jgi:hypothetical protein